MHPWDRSQTYQKYIYGIDPKPIKNGFMGSIPSLSKMNTWDQSHECIFDMLGIDQMGEMGLHIITS